MEHTDSSLVSFQSSVSNTRSQIRHHFSRVLAWYSCNFSRLNYNINHQLICRNTTCIHHYMQRFRPVIALMKIRANRTKALHMINKRGIITDWWLSTALHSFWAQSIAWSRSRFLTLNSGARTVEPAEPYSNAFKSNGKICILQYCCGNESSWELNDLKNSFCSSWDFIYRRKESIYEFISFS